MPLPLPNLDTRRWADLVEEGRSLIPRYAPGWTDHNIHDPGITLMELFAWVTDLAIYRTNAIPARHRRKFLALIGFPSQAPHPAQTAFAFTLNGLTEQELPAGTTIATPRLSGSNALLRFQTTDLLTVLSCNLKAIQSFDGSNFANHIQAHYDGTLYYPWGSNPPLPNKLKPEQQPTLYLGFEQALPPAKTLSLWLQFVGRGTDWQERDRILTEIQQANEACQSLHRQNTCPPETSSADRWCSSDVSPTSSASPMPSFRHSLQHHTIQTIWEYYNGSHWQSLDPTKGEIVDETRGFSLSGAVCVTVPGSMGAIPIDNAIGNIFQALFYLRCRLVKGLPDAAPLLSTVGVNAVAAQQFSPVRSTFPIAIGAILSGVPTVGQLNKLHFELSNEGAITRLTVNPEGEALEVWVLDYQAAGGLPGSLTLTLSVLDRGSGFPSQTIRLESEIAIAQNQIRLWTLNGNQLLHWQQQPDLDASHRTDAHFQWEPAPRTLTFGDGEQGRVVPEGAWILAAYDTTAGASGDILKSVPWQLVGADDEVNRAVLGLPQSALRDLGQKLMITPCAPFLGGADQEDLDHAAGRAVETLWAHERLIDLCTPTHSSTLDQVKRATVLSSQAPERATTLLDFERLALEVPGTRVARTRAWAGLDPAYPCLKAPGTVTVVVVPELPQQRPQPSPELLDTVQRYLNRRRSIGTRLVVVAPDYLEVQVQAKVQTQRNADPGRVSADVLTALNHFLNPLKGGTDGYGWQFGRDVYRTEVLQVIDEVAGVDHVVELRLVGRPVTAEQAQPNIDDSNTNHGSSTNDAQCGNLCVAPTQLVTSGQHTIQVMRGGT